MTDQTCPISFATSFAVTSLDNTGDVLMSIGITVPIHQSGETAADWTMRTEVRWTSAFTMSLNAARQLRDILALQVQIAEEKMKRIQEAERAQRN